MLGLAHLLWRGHSGGDDSGADHCHSYCGCHDDDDLSQCVISVQYIIYIHTTKIQHKIMSRIFSSKSISVSGVDEVVGESDSKRSKKENKSLISSAKKEKKKSKEKETRYAHLGDESSGEDEADGK